MNDEKMRDSVFLKDDSYYAHVNPETRNTQSVREHLSGTMELAERNCPLEILRYILKVAILLHDAGKLGDDFFGYMKDILTYGEKAMKRQSDHITAGGRILEELVGKNLTSEFIGTVVYSHHGLQDNINMESGETLFEKRREKGIELEKIQQRYFEIIDRKILMKYLIAAHGELQKLLGQIDAFVQSSEERNCGNRKFYLGMFARLALSVLIDSDWTDTACFFQGEPHPERISADRIQEIWQKSITHFETYVKHLSDSGEKSRLDIYRREISDRCFRAAEKENRLYRLTVPTGAGKTLSSLRFALHHARKYHRKHIIYVAPYNSILEQNAEEIRRAVGNDEFVLEHHCNVFFEDENKELAYRKLAESWDSPIIVTTAVQMLNTLFSAQKSSLRRMHSLCNSVIIFDEVQAFPVRGTELFNLAVNFLAVFCNTTVVLCSATQPSLARLKENNLFRCTEMAGLPGQYAEAFKRVEIEDRTDAVPGGMQAEDISELAWKALRKYGSVLIIVNTKECAKRIYKELKKACCEECELYHLSTSMCPKNRKDELEAIRRNLNPDSRKPVICVSTQLIEAGVDLSFGCVIRSLAGLDSIIQAAGRCNRHDEMDSGKVYIVRMSQDAEYLGELHDIVRAQNAAEKFLDYFKEDPDAFGGSLDSEASAAAYFGEYLYDFGAVPTKYPIYSCKTTMEELLGKNEPGCRQYMRRHGGKAGLPCMCQAFATAGKAYRVIDGEAEETVVVPYDEIAKKAIDVLENGSASLSEQRKAVRTLQQYSVGISRKLAEKLDGAVRRTGDASVYVLSMDYYDKKEGVLKKPKK